MSVLLQCYSAVVVRVVHVEQDYTQKIISYADRVIHRLVFFFF